MTNEHKVINDLVEELKQRTSDERLAQLSSAEGCAEDVDFVDWHAKIDELQLSEACMP